MSDTKNIHIQRVPAGHSANNDGCVIVTTYDAEGKKPTAKQHTLEEWDALQQSQPE